jgi:hypothetical protein
MQVKKTAAALIVTGLICKLLFIAIGFKYWLA